MEQSKIDRINELSRIARERALTAEETQERKALRDEYIAAFRTSLETRLDNTVIIRTDGTREPLKKTK